MGIGDHTMIHTDRLRCEPLCAHHAAVMFPILQPESLYTYLPTDPPPSLESLQERYNFLSGGKSPDGTEDWLNWILFLRENGQAIGFFQATVKLLDSCNIAYSIHPDFWRKGLAKEATNRLITHLFEEYDVPTMTAFIDTRNSASIRLMESLGFRPVKIIKEADEFKGTVSDEVVYEMLRSTWDDRNNLEDI